MNSNPPQPQPGPAPMETLLGGAEFAVKKLNGFNEAVTIRQLSIRDCPKLLARIDDEPACAEIYCGKPPGWANDLTNEAIEAIIIEGERINADFFGRWCQRLARRRALTMPDLMQQIVASALQTSSPSAPSTSASRSP